ncbi:alpha/beta fold hydrolase [Arachnia propionica]|uniref:thioesterase II family protein n=1 Tax=Arachnia propionica TaxID=1750 RepID=UPI0030CFDEBE
MMNPPSSWLRRFTPATTPEAQLLLLCPHAGAGASSYRDLASALVTELETFPAIGISPAEIVVAHYPGRQDRAADSVPTTVLGYAEGLLPETESLIRLSDAPRPITIFGHSMGGLIGYELARLLQRRGLPVRLLVVSATYPPQLTKSAPAHPTDDETLLEHLAALEGTNIEVLRNQDVLSLVLPALKADYAAFDSYTDGNDEILTAPVLALGGWDDPGVNPAVLRGWAERTTGKLKVVMFPGDHFFIKDSVTTVAGTVAQEVDEQCR